MMEHYKNIHGDSDVHAYELADDAITVQFSDGGTYVYTYASAGREAVEAMKKRAVRGEGLATYINTHVRESYARKLA